VTGKSPCEECVKIAQELNEAFAELWLSADQNFRDAWRASIKLMGGTEEDMQRAEELFPKAKNEGNAKVAAAIHRKFMHLALSGHNVPYPVPPE
jgi:hypothetical protein